MKQTNTTNANNNYKTTYAHIHILYINKISTYIHTYIQTNNTIQKLKTNTTTVTAILKNTNRVQK